MSLQSATRVEMNVAADGGRLVGRLSALLSHMSEVALFCPASIYVVMIALAAFVAIATNKKSRRDAAMEVLRTLLLRRRGR